MQEKLKMMSIGNKKLKLKDSKNWELLIERYAPNMYDIFNVVGAEEALKQIVTLHPNIIIMSNNLKGSIGLLSRIKEICPQTPVFVVLGMVDDEQETIDEYMSHGAYKCYPVPLVMDTLVHDMYVALNLE